MKRAWLWILGALAIAAAAGYGVHRSHQSAAVQPLASVAPTAASTAAVPASSSSLNDNQPWTVQRQQTLSSLRGTQADGSIEVGPNGRLKPGIGLRHLFDYYLALIGEAPFPAIRQLLQQDLVRRGLDASVSAEVMQDFDKYVHLQRASLALGSQNTTTSMADKLVAVRALRSQILGPELAKAFYGADQQREDQEVAELKINTDKTLSPDERKARIAELEGADNDQNAIVRQQQVGATAEQLTAELDAQHADAATRFQARSALWGDEAATRLAALDQQRAQWQQRVDAYRQASAALDANQDLSAEQRQQQRQSLLQAGFSPTEQVRLQAVLGNPAPAPTP